MSQIHSLEYGHEDTKLPKQLDEVVEAGVIIHEGCYVLASELARNPHIRIAQCHDRTGYESFLNHIHLKDYGDDRLSVAFGCLRKISSMLQRDFPDVKFVGVVSSKPDGQDCVLRFYSKHEGEPSWVAENLEGYELEAICVLDLSLNSG